MKDLHDEVTPQSDEEGYLLQRRRKDMVDNPPVIERQLALAEHQRKTKSTSSTSAHMLMPSDGRI